MTFERTIYNQLQEWKARSNRKPLILRGARQVGKTTLIKTFGNEYKQSIFLNMEKPEVRNLFETYHDVRTLVEALFLSRNITSGIDNTLLFIDEIQEEPKAIQQLRYFFEEIPELHVIAAGSLLEFAMRKVVSFPVGRIEYLYLYPLNFIEYLKALEHKAALEQLSIIPVKPFANTTLLKLFHDYAIIGGMPEVVKTYIEENSFLPLPRIYQSIWDTYKNDVEKYAGNDTEKKVIKHIISTAHFYIDQRIKFQNFGNSNYRSREVGESMRNLDDAKVIQLIYPTTDLDVPVKPNLKKSPKLLFLDTGILNYQLGIQSQMLGMNDLSNVYKGSVIPHLIMQEFITLNNLHEQKPYFWVREKKQSSSEVDMVVSYNNMVIPVEIKSGTTGSLKSLHQFIERCGHPYAIRMYAGEFKVEKAKTPGGVYYLLMNLPYYLGTKIFQYIDYFINNYKLF